MKEIKITVVSDNGSQSKFEIDADEIVSKEQKTFTYTDASGASNSILITEVYVAQPQTFMRCVETPDEIQELYEEAEET